MLQKGVLCDGVRADHSPCREDAQDRSTLLGIHTRKTDSQRQQDVMAELEWEPAVHAEQIGVEVKDDAVTLPGTAHITDHLGGSQVADRPSLAAQRAGARCSQISFRRRNQGVNGAL